MFSYFLCIFCGSYCFVFSSFFQICILYVLCIFCMLYVFVFLIFVFCKKVGFFVFFKIQLCFRFLYFWKIQNRDRILYFFVCSKNTNLQPRTANRQKPPANFFDNQRNVVRLPDKHERLLQKTTGQLPIPPISMRSKWQIT